MIHVTVITGGRADWGLLSPVCRGLRDDPFFNLRIVATGQHLMSNCESLNAIEAEGFSVDARIDMGLSEKTDTASRISKALARGIDGVAEEFENNRPDLLLILGDRYEILGVVQAATIFKIPTAHLFGGDITEGAIDDAMRHAITKMSHLHFVTNEEAQKRVLQMGENPKNVFCVGSTGLDHILNMKKMERDDFFQSIDFSPKDKNILVTFHPVTLEEDSIEQCNKMLGALDRFGQDIGIILTGSNADPQGQEITAVLKAYAKRKNNACFHSSLGTHRYLNALCHVNAVVGNSSSGLYEVPSFGIATVNIGDRQKGRIKAKTVIDCAPTEEDIYSAVAQALNMKKGHGGNPYGNGHSAEKIVKILKSVNYNSELCRKTFIDRDIKL